MARAETIESVGETGGAANGPLPGQNTCRMELPRSLHAWAGAGAMHLHHNHPLHTLQALYLSYPLPYPDPQDQDQDQSQTHQQLPPALLPSATPPPPPSPLCNRRDERSQGGVAPSDLSGEQLDREEYLQASSRQGPPPDLLPQNEHPSWASPRHRAPRGEVVQELELRRVANQLRVIGDEFNATMLHRAHVAPHWQDWRDACRGLLNFITQTLSTLYRLT